MVKVRNTMVIGALLVALAAFGVAPATAQSSSTKPKAQKRLRTLSPKAGSRTKG